MATNIDNENIKKKINKLPANVVIIAIIIFIVGGYAFFFLSPNMFEEDENALMYSELDKEYTIGNGHTFIIDSWCYSKAESKMEVVLTYDNTTLDGINKYNYSFISRNANKSSSVYLDFERYYESPTLAVITVQNVPEDFSELAMIISYESNGDLSSNNTSQSNDSTDAVVTKNVSSKTVYTNKVKIDYVDEISKQSVADIYITKLEKNAKSKQEDIDSVNADIQAQKDAQTNILSMVSELRKNETYMTESEKAEAEAQISSYQSSYNACETTIDDYKKKLQEYQDELDEINDKIDQIKNGDIMNDDTSKEGDK